MRRSTVGRICDLLWLLFLSHNVPFLLRTYITSFAQSHTYIWEITHLMYWEATFWNFPQTIYFAVIFEQWKSKKPWLIVFYFFLCQFLNFSLSPFSAIWKFLSGCFYWGAICMLAYSPRTSLSATILTLWKGIGFFEENSNLFKIKSTFFWKWPLFSYLLVCP